ncbi:MAG: diguanylate cyclase, partial [Clostridia bacterium]|nr:diguanylate cyclase [Clostridia bacterium]
MASDTDLLASLAEERRGAFRPWGLYLLRFLALAAGAVLTELVGYTYLGPWIRGHVAQVRPLSEASWRMLWLLVVDTPGLFGLVLYFTHVDRLRLTSLAFQREAFRALFDHTVDAAAILDLGGRVVAVNRAAEEILGRPRAELLGARGWSWFPEAQIPEATRRFREAFLHPVAPLELAARHPEGREVSLLTRFVPIYRSGRAIGAFCIASDVSALKAAVEQAERLARRDPLTGLANRRELEERLAEAIREARARRGLLAVMYVDLDNFKLVNDALGHEAGDAVLAAVARRLEGCVRGDETVARFGGDEFVVVLPRLSAVENAEAVALRIVRRLGEPVAWDGYQFSLTASVGIALYPAAGETAEALLKNADAALYEAKRQGKNRYHVHMPYLTQRAWDRLRLESELRRVLRDPEREFYVEYQPQVDLESGRVVSAEALVRWRHPELGNIPPAEFIPVAEEVGLIHKIGSFVLQEVCRQIARWREEGRLPLPVAVNVSPAE